MDSWFIKNYKIRLDEDPFDEEEHHYSKKKKYSDDEDAKSNSDDDEYLKKDREYSWKIIRK